MYNGKFITLDRLEETLEVLEPGFDDALYIARRAKEQYQLALKLQEMAIEKECRREVIVSRIKLLIHARFFPVLYREMRWNILLQLVPENTDSVLENISAAYIACFLNTVDSYNTQSE